MLSHLLCVRKRVCLAATVSTRGRSARTNAEPSKHADIVDRTKGQGRSQAVAMARSCERECERYPVQVFVFDSGVRQSRVTRQCLGGGSSSDRAL